MPKLKIPKAEFSDEKPDLSVKVKQKRKNAHQVRKYFQSAGPTKQKCNFCGWETRENATRMVQHIVQRCNDATSEARDEISASVVDAEERLMQSFFTSHNKKVVHDFFKSVDNDRKRQCVFCKWTTILNLTRMRYHILQMCHYVPPTVRQSFLKQEHSDDSQYDTYCIVNVDDGDRKGLQVVSSSSLEHADAAVVQEVVINSDDYMDQVEPDTYYEEEVAEQLSQDHPDDLPVKKSASDDEIELDLEEDENQSEELPEAEAPEDEGKKAELQFVNVTERYYTVKKRNVLERSPPVKTVNVTKQRATEVRKNQTIRQSPKPTTLRIVPQKNQSRLSEEQMNKFRTRLAIASTPKQTAVVRKEQDATKSPPRKSDQTAPQKEKRDENSIPLLQKSVTIVKTSQQVKHRAGTSTSLQNTPRQESDAAVPEDQGSCHSFGGGHVYPQEAPRFVDHKLQYTKAVISRPAPEFEATAVVDGAFKKIKLSDYRGKYLVFFFYPLDFTFVCPTEILAFSDRVNEFKKLNTEVIAASIDSHFTHLAWINTPRKEGGLGTINIPLVSDITHTISKDYGVFLDDLGHTLRGLFIIDDRGILRQITMNDLPVGRSVDETLRLVQAFQYTDKHGEVCPAGWKPGQDTIVPNPEAKIKYFEKNH
ncbi:uncharacterized protein LOC128711023 [Anopheles marshallii]|uniref:uncharacterized protein LOC128711023 n=1 Tax=Anopheles marshallii TaxID=1521116 RepID=UPI00237B0403|nr:uncharacterized protein LOC128711023 [Anopheles marshallii]